MSDYLERESGAIPAELQPGSAVLYTGSVLHAGGQNNTLDRWRMAVHLSYVVGWLTPGGFGRIVRSLWFVGACHCC